MIHSIVQYRGLLWLFVRRDLRMRYAGSVLGSFWNVIHPLIMVGIYIVIFGQVMANMAAGSERAGGLSRLDYAIHLCAGIIPWLLFSEILTRSGNVLLENGNFLRKLAFPAEILPLSIFVNAFILHGISAVFLMGLLLVLGVPLGPTALCYFLVMLGMGAMALGLGLFVSIINVYVRDFGQFLQILLQFLFWMLPILWYREDMGPFIQMLFDWNPLSYFIRAGQAMLAPGAEMLSPRGHVVVPPGAHDLPHMILWPTVLLTLGAMFFRQQRQAVLDEL